jgi:hypothetical protein
MAVAPQEIKLNNPFRLFKDEAEMYDAVEDFARAHGLLEHLVSLKVAARFLRDDIAATLAEDFPLDAKNALNNEHKIGFWRGSKSLKSAVTIVGALAGVCQGWTQSVLCLTAPWIMHSFRNVTDARGLNENKSNVWLLGGLSACVLLASGVL